jgi:hypothetical protein
MRGIEEHVRMKKDSNINPVNQQTPKMNREIRKG